MPSDMNGNTKSNTQMRKTERRGNAIKRYPPAPYQIPPPQFNTIQIVAKPTNTRHTRNTDHRRRRRTESLSETAEEKTDVKLRTLKLRLH